MTILSSLIEECLSVDKLLSGGLSITLDVTELASNHVQLKKAIEAASGIPFFRPMVKLMVCNSCGKRSGSGYLERCEFCRSSQYAADSLIILNNHVQIVVFLRLNMSIIPLFKLTNYFSGSQYF